MVKWLLSTTRIKVAKNNILPQKLPGKLGEKVAESSQGHEAAGKVTLTHYLLSIIIIVRPRRGDLDSQQQSYIHSLINYSRSFYTDARGVVYNCTVMTTTTTRHPLLLLLLLKPRCGMMTCDEETGTVTRCWRQMMIMMRRQCVCGSPWQSLDARLASPISAGDDIIIIFSWSSLIGVVCSGVAATQLRSQPVALILSNHTGLLLLSQQCCMNHDCRDFTSNCWTISLYNSLLYKIFFNLFHFTVVQLFKSNICELVVSSCTHASISRRQFHIDVA